jgi:hypothetical protein
MYFYIYIVIYCIGSLFPIYLRHHFLLELARLQKLQTKLPFGPKMVELKKKLQTTRYWASETSVWKMFGLFILVPTALLIYFTSVYEMGNPTARAAYKNASNMILGAEALAAFVFNLWYQRGVEKDPYGIKTQFRACALLVISYVVVSTTLKFLTYDLSILGDM